MAEAYLHVRVTDTDRPVVTKDTCDDCDDETLVIGVAPGINIVGPSNTLQRWVRDLAVQVAQMDE